MPAIPTHSEEAAGLKGLHLFFAAQSACSSRVRLLLAEKGIPWTGHHLDLLKKENVDPAYFAINPRGLVPTLVDDGQVVIESADIMFWLERRFPEPGFTPEGPADRAAMEEWVVRSATDHVKAVKTYAYIRRNAKAAAKTAEEVELYYRLQKDPEMLAFHARHDGTGDPFTEQDLQAAAELIETLMAQMEAAITADGWLAGPAYSLADMAWAAAWRTWELAGYPLDRHPVLCAWFARIADRPAWREIARLWAEPPRERVLQFAGA
ncbi:MAG: glutathione S-transferase family protein [Novosphingobium sp.]|nr:glutathione S-transferase family protein [Novosphingobium sp.]MBO9601595.1 glutathione S-transferase family protein [Novosphingobium sp.]